MGAALSQTLWGVQVAGPLNVAARDLHNHYHRVEPDSEGGMPSILESVPNFRAIHIATLGRATPGTGLWIVECEKFRLWLDPEGWLRIMWGYGMPGAGKTIAASIVIDAIEAHANQSTSAICVCYIYFRYSDHTQATTRSFLEVLVKQTLERHTGCLPLFNETYARHIREKTQPTEKELLCLLRQYTTAMVTFYVLDALDEAPTEIQLEIIERLTSLDVKLFITSRPLKNVEAAFPSVHRFRIVARASDLNLYIDKEISRSGELRAILERGGISLQDSVYASVKAKASGMFLHASLQLTALRECMSVYEVEQTLAAFPTDIGDMYLQTWQRILDQRPNKVTLAKKVLLWVLHAASSLTTETLEQVIATCPDTYQYHSNRLVPVDTLVGLCRGLVTVEKKTRLVRLVHYTAKDALQRLISDAFPQPHSILSATCLTRLTDCGFQCTTLDDDQQLQQALKAEPLLRYAYNSWFIHARQSRADPLAQVRLAKFVENCHAFPITRDIHFDVLGPLHLVAYFNLPITFAGSDNLQSPNECTARLGLTALHLACMQGHDDAVKELLDVTNILVDAEDVFEMTPLMWASSEGQEGAARLLIAHPDIDINAADEEGWIALMWAADNGHKDVVTLLLSHPDTDVNMTDDINSNALIQASGRGQEEVVAVLLSHPDVDVNAADLFGRTALSSASKNGRGETVKLLLSHPQVNVNVEDHFRYTPLYEAASWGKDDVVRLLLSHPLIQVRTKELEAARVEGYQDIVCLLEEFLSRS
ncbi:hypothetical protein BKA70DRAFT_207428 [Coprinopsis sp. MPI-PUGE-AT-0042]|nr:hypothetical protein BKA70DRAFT_207428 [Coprinopsis sp. MPI-PUGE-AT-0042]